MPDSRAIPCSPSLDVDALVRAACPTLNAQGFDVVIQTSSFNSAVIQVRKDVGGLQSVLALGLSTTATIARSGGCLVISCASEWVGKIIAIVVGWIFCFVPLITGVVGCVQLSELPSKIATALTIAVANNERGI